MVLGDSSTNLRQPRTLNAEMIGLWSKNVKILRALKTWYPRVTEHSRTNEQLMEYGMESKTQVFKYNENLNDRKTAVYINILVF